MCLLPRFTDLEQLASLARLLSPSFVSVSLIDDKSSLEEKTKNGMEKTLFESHETK